MAFAVSTSRLALASLLALSVCLTLLQLVEGQATTPLFDSSVCGSPIAGTRDNVLFVADSTSTCWYHRCLGRGDRARLITRRCAHGSAVSSFFGTGARNPCTEIFDRSKKFDCTRKMFNLDGQPPCVQEYQQQGTCKNGGRVMSELGRCTCDCSDTGFADWDCSKRPQDLIGAPSVHPNSDDPCPNGIPLENHCRVASVGGVGPCQNNGRCINECTDYVCQCISPFTAGRNCETFDCTDNVECLNNGTCSRGPRGNDQFATCTCQPGFSGLMCEIISQA